MKKRSDHRVVANRPERGLKTYAALTLEQRKQVLEKAQDERINKIVAEAMRRALLIRSVTSKATIRRRRETVFALVKSNNDQALRRRSCPNNSKSSIHRPGSLAPNALTYPVERYLYSGSTVVGRSTNRQPRRMIKQIFGVCYWRAPERLKRIKSYPASPTSF
jgi:hypothetical protein